MSDVKVQRSAIQGYINNFRRFISLFMKPDLGVKCTVYPAKKDGAVLRFEFGTYDENEDVYKMEVATVNKALSKIPQHAFGGNLDGFNFKGTNIIMESNGVIIIKDGDPKEWAEESAKADVNRIVPRTIRG
ncbi:hypothetical protein KIH32_19455 [Pseudomonas fluorescens]|uniref:hypothetical protein n=1 Tax=Pseudomonas fluorescens TaxID=294 RepID=UPI001BD92D8D|nr:hypothetical protein [Pseudomonas fluorescens]MBT0626096.1 hypothetical protein [Pseudomonas fluorescens]